MLNTVDNGGRMEAATAMVKHYPDFHVHSYNTYLRLI